MALPRILHHNILAQATSVVASSSAAGFPVANLSDGRPYTWWKPSAMNATIEVDAGVSVDADGLYIPAHTLDSTFCDVSVYAADLPFSGMQKLTFPEDFSNAVWVKSAAGAGAAPVVTVDVDNAPDGTSTADKIVFSAPGAGDTSSISQAPASLAVGTYSGSFYIKAFSGADVGKIVAFRHVASGAYQLVTLTANWVRISNTEVHSVDNFELALRPDVGTSSGTVSAIIWGALLNLGSSDAPYIPQTAGRWISETALAFSNRIPSPRDLSTLGASFVSVVANAAVAPNGSKEATQISDADAANIGYVALSSMEQHNGESGESWSVSIAKTTADAHYCAVGITKYSGGTTVDEWLLVNTNTGALTVIAGAPLDYGIEDAGDFWWVWVKASSTGSTENKVVRLYFYPAYNTDGTATGAVAATGSKIVWGAKLEKTLGRPTPFREDAPLYLPFTSTRKRYWLLRFNRKTGAALPAIGELVLGKALELPTGMPQGLDPIGRRVMGSRNNNERGQPMGRSVDFESSEYEITQEEIAWAWVRNVWLQAWRNGLRSEPFGFIWDFESHVEDVLLVTAAEEFRTPHKSGLRCTLRLRVQGVPT